MTPFFLALGGLVAFAAAVLLLRSFGDRGRVGRLLAAIPAVTIAEARRLGEAGEARYVRIDGRIDADAEFEDADHKPLVLRRTTVEWGEGASRGDASVIRAVPFLLREGLDEIAVAADEINVGLVVVPRVSEGRVGDIWGPDAAADQAGLTPIRRVADFPDQPAGVPLDAPARLRLELVSSVEHAAVLGVPTRRPDGTLEMAAGAGRPLVLSTLEGDEAMRILSGGAVGRSRAAIALLVASGLLLAASLLWWLVDAIVAPGTALAASPEPSIRPGNDTRTPGASSGFVGAPLLAIGGVLIVAGVSLLASLAWVRLTGRNGPGPRPPRT